MNSGGLEVGVDRLGYIFALSSLVFNPLFVPDKGLPLSELEFNPTDKPSGRPTRVPTENSTDGLVGKSLAKAMNGSKLAPWGEPTVVPGEYLTEKPAERFGWTKKVME